MKTMQEVATLPTKQAADKMVRRLNKTSGLRWDVMRNGTEWIVVRVVETTWDEDAQAWWVALGTNKFWLAKN